MVFPTPRGGAEGGGSAQPQRGGGQGRGSSGIIFFCHNFFNFEKSYQIVPECIKKSICRELLFLAAERAEFFFEFHILAKVGEGQRVGARNFVRGGATCPF